LDHLVSGGQQRLGDGEVEGFGGLEVDDQFELGWLDDWQLAGFLAFENAPGIDAKKTIGMVVVAAFASRAATTPEATITATWRRTRPATSTGSRSY